MHHFQYGATYYANMVVLGSPPTHNKNGSLAPNQRAKLSCLVPFPLALRQVSLGIRIIAGMIIGGFSKKRTNSSHHQNGKKYPPEVKHGDVKSSIYRACSIINPSFIIIYRGFPLPCLITRWIQMVCFYILEIKTLWTHAHPCNPASHLMKIRDVYPTIDLWFLCWQIQGKPPSVIFVGPTDMSFSR